MTLTERIQQHASAEATAKDWDKVAEILNALTVVVRDSTPLTYARITREFGDAVRQKVAGTLRAIAASQHPLAGEVSDAHVVLLNELVGLDISSDDRQAVIDLIATAGGWSTDEAVAIKSLGVRVEFVIVTTTAECEAAMLTASRDAIISRLNAAATIVAISIRSGTATTDDEIASQFAVAIGGV